MWIIYTKTLILEVKGLHPLRSFPWKWRKDDPLGKSSTLNSNNLGDRTVSRHINPCFINFFDKIFWKLFRKYIIWFIKLWIKLDIISRACMISSYYYYLHYYCSMLANFSIEDKKVKESVNVTISLQLVKPLYDVFSFISKDIKKKSG